MSCNGSVEDCGAVVCLVGRNERKVAMAPSKTLLMARFRITTVKTGVASGINENCFNCNRVKMWKNKGDIHDPWYNTMDGLFCHPCGKVSLTL
jgi:hypothetical protein